MGEWANPDGFSATFRCTEVKYAKNFVEKGEMKFSSANKWVEYAKSRGDGRGDLFEGCLAGCNYIDLANIAVLCGKYYKDDDIYPIQIGPSIYFKSNRSMGLPCLCFYIMKHSVFNCPDIPGWHHISADIPATYFRDFADNKSPIEIEALPEGDRPSLIFISDFNTLKERIKHSLLALGLTEDEIIIRSVRYTKIRGLDGGWFITAEQRPYELTFKDNSFIHQSEARIIINTHKRDILEFLENNVITVGSLEDIAQRSDSYLHEGMRVEMDVHLTPENGI